MANFDPIRRAEIGRERRAKTRAQLLAAAKSLFARRAIESVTVDDVVKEAGVAKGTFYIHFKDLQELIATVAVELVATIDSLLQPGRLSLADPAHRIAFGCCCFIDKAFGDPEWAGVVARMAAAAPKGVENARFHLFEDLSQLPDSLPGNVPPGLALEIVAGIMLQLASAIAERRLSPGDREVAVGAILRAIGLGTREVKAALACLPPFNEAALPISPGEASGPGRRPAGRTS